MRNVVLGGLVVVAGVSAAVYFGISARKPIAEAEPDEAVSVQKNSEATPIAQEKKPVARKNAPSGKRVRKPGQPIRFEETFDDPEHPYSPADKSLAKELQDILDDITQLSDGPEESARRSLREKSASTEAKSPVEIARQKLYALAEKACKSSNPSVRQRGVAALSWEGGDALAELTPMMADPNEEVAEMAIDAVEQALEEQENPNLRFEAAAAYMSTFSANEDALTMLSGTLTSAALEIIEPSNDSAAAAQQAYDNRVMVVDSLATMIETGSHASAEAAKEAFSDITGSDWINRAEAESWAKDPDNYEAPER